MAFSDQNFEALLSIAVFHRVEHKKLIITMVYFTNFMAKKVKFRISKIKK